jgi:hypothetical protein
MAAPRRVVEIEIGPEGLWCKLLVVVPFQPTDELRAVRWQGFWA